MILWQEPEVWEPHPYQEKSIDFVLDSGCGSLWLDPGLGKTAVTLECIRRLREANQVRRVLVVAPLRVVYAVWPMEILKWKQFNDLTISIVHGDKWKAFNRDADIHVINYDGLQWLHKAMRENPQLVKYDMLVCDEISMLKNTRSARFKSLAPFLDIIPRRVGLTGTPASNSLIDVFGPQLIIDRGATFGKFITHFRNKYFFPSGYGGYEWKLQNGAEDAIYKALSPSVLRLKAEDYLQMPELSYNRVYVDLPPKARDAYNKMEQDLILRLHNGDVVASNAAVAVMKCQQIANGGLYLDNDEGEREVLHIHDAKTEAVEDIVEELQGRPVMICYHFRHDMLRLMKAFPHAAHIGSGVTGDHLNDIVTRWNAGEIPVLLVHPQSAGHGLNLQGGTGSTIIFYSLTYSLEHHDQVIRRLYRQGQRNNVMVHYIIAAKTIDHAILGALNRKDGVQQNLMNAVQEYAKALET
jgi:SNF2 family DNA or RNA helicase